MRDSAFAAVLAMSEKIDAAPPFPRAIIARFDVPFGRAFRMWDTRGRFVVYVHRGFLLDSVRHARPGERGGALGLLGVPLGIPIHFEPGRDA